MLTVCTPEITAPPVASTGLPPAAVVPPTVVTVRVLLAPVARIWSPACSVDGFTTLEPFPFTLTVPMYCTLPVVRFGASMPVVRVKFVWALAFVPSAAKPELKPEPLAPKVVTMLEPNGLVIPAPAPWAATAASSWSMALA